MADLFWSLLTQSVSISLFKDAFIEKRFRKAAAAHEEFSLEGRLFLFSCREPIYACELCSHGLYMPLIMPIQPRFCLSRSQMFK